MRTSLSSSSSPWAEESGDATPCPPVVPHPLAREDPIQADSQVEVPHSDVATSIAEGTYETPQEDIQGANQIPPVEQVDQSGNSAVSTVGSTTDSAGCGRRIEEQYLPDDSGDSIEFGEKATNSRSSFWLSFLPQSFASGCSKQPNSRLYQLNSIVRRAVSSGPMRRLQERFLGCRWDSSASSNINAWLLGVPYTLCDNGASGSASTEAYSKFLTDFSSRIWLTYRKGFEPIGPSQLTSDVGWGCMIRSGQMLFAQALVCCNLGREWRRNLSEPNAPEYLKILEYFGDEASPGCPFSLHNIVSAGYPYGLVAGSWLGPYALCRTLEALAHSAGNHSKGEKCEFLVSMRVYVVSGDADGERGGAPCICIDDVEKLFSGEWTPLLLLVPLVLGLEKVNTRYLPSLWASFTFPQSLGIAGGKPGASTYIVGVQGDEMLYLDPHEVQQVIHVSSDRVDVDTSSYHCSNLKRMQLDAIDPSLALGFYCQNREEFDDLCKRASDLAMASNGAPMFTVIKSCSKVEQKMELCVCEDEIFKQDEDLASRDASFEEDWQML